MPHGEDADYGDIDQPVTQVSSAVTADVRRQIAELKQRHADGMMPKVYLDMELSKYAAFFGRTILKEH